jgi:hypothetical protein
MTTLRRNTVGRYDFVGVSLESKDLAKYVTQLDYPVVTDFSPATKSDYKMGGTPATIVVSPDNKILRVWTGAYKEPTITEISTYFGVRLPGLAPAEKALAKN